MGSIKRNLVDEEVTLSNFPLNLYQHEVIEINHENKTNHKIFFSFKVLESDKSIQIYCLSDVDFEDYVIQTSNKQGLEPTKYQFVTEKTHEVLKKEIPISRSSRIHFLVVKKYQLGVPFRWIIDEEWDEKETEVKVLPNIPLTDNRLSKKIKELITDSKKTLKIVSPYADLHLMDELSSAIGRGVDLRLIIRNYEKDRTHSTTQAFPHLQKLLKENLRTNNNIHARLLISDNESAIVMSSDLSQDSMQNLINCGIHVTDSSVISELSDFFERVWNDSKKTAK